MSRAEISSPSAENEGEERVPFLQKHQWILGLALVLVTIAAYSQVWRCGYIWDDNFYVTQNTTLRDLNGLRQIWSDPHVTLQYYPLVHTTFWLEYHLWALNPIGYHIVNVVLHALGAVLLWRVLRVLRIPGAWLASAIFALHPVAVESVAWITERKNVLSAVFYFAAALTYLRFAATAGATDRRKRWGSYAAAFVLFACALLSKTVTCSLPAALLLVIWWKAGQLRWRHVWPLLPFFVAGLGLGLFTAWLERHDVRAEGAAWSFTIVERILIAGRALWFYPSKLLWPATLTFIYPRWEMSVSDPWQWIFPAGVLLVIAALWFARSRIGRAPLVALLFFAGTLFPALGFFDVYPFRYSFVADHFQYLASVGLIALVAAGLVRLPQIVSVLVLAALAALTWLQVGIYRDLETLWRDTVEKNPKSWMAQTSYAAVLLSKGELDESVAHLRTAETLDPNNVEVQNNLGSALVQMGRLDDAFPYFKRALELNPNGSAAVFYNVGNALLQKGQAGLAIDYFASALKADPTYLPAYSDMGHALLLVGRVDDSFEYLQHALAVEPNYSAAHSNLANTLLQMGRSEEAVAHLREVLAARPHDAEALKNMAWVLATSPEATIRDGAKAVELAESASQLATKPDPVFTVTLAAAYAEMARFPEAIATAERALELAAASGNTALVAFIRQQLELYRLELPFRDNR